MKSSKEFFERLNSDEAFAKEVVEAITAKREAGAKSYYETFIPVAAEHGYEISREELDTINNRQLNEMSEEELGKVAGGTSCFPMSVSISLASLTGVTIASVIVSLATGDD